MFSLSEEVQNFAGFPRTRMPTQILLQLPHEASLGGLGVAQEQLPNPDMPEMLHEDSWGGLGFAQGRLCNPDMQPLLQKDSPGGLSYRRLCIQAMRPLPHECSSRTLGFS